MMDKVSAPPGFVSRTSFRLQTLGKNEDACRAAGCADVTEASQRGPSPSRFDVSDFRKSFEQKPWIVHNQGKCRRMESTVEWKKKPNYEPCLPRGVIRGCPDCPNCLKVLGRWRPKGTCTPLLEEAPVFYPTEEDFEDMPKYIASIRPSAEGHGICRIVPPPSWVPSCPEPEGDIWENTKFTTLVQHISELHVDFSNSKTGTDSKNTIGKKRKLSGFEFQNGHVSNFDVVECESQRFEFEKGPDLSIKEFKKSADEFRLQYFDRKGEEVLVSSTTSSKDFKPTIEDVEGEYWRIIENPTEDIEVLAGVDLDTRTFGSVFPMVSKVHDSTNSKLLKSGWNLRNIGKLPDSLLTFETNDASVVLHSRLYFGMCFSSYCWKVEDSLLYSLYYMHTGGPKIWYGIPGRYFFKFQATVNKYYPGMVSGKPEMLYKLVRQLPISTLKSEGIPVYRCVQHQREFILIFPGAYHSAFDCGFNCVELGNYASVDWLPYGQMAAELYSELAIKGSISPDKLMLKASNEAVKALWNLSLLRKNVADHNLIKWKSFTGKDGILVKALKLRIKWIESRRKYLCDFSRTKKMDSDLDEEIRRECCICHCDLYLSAIGCSCSTDKFSCLNHAKQLCACPWRSRVLLFRYENNQLKLLVEALEGKLSAAYRWAKESLGLLVQTQVRQVTNQPSPLESSGPLISQDTALDNIVADAVAVFETFNSEKYKAQILF
uniref:Uncharacterized protein n=1 Tax=Kalanchoe fedtschenkoi TaxID=63787 RepID=A0A7N0U9Q5_KALFE